MRCVMLISKDKILRRNSGKIEIAIRLQPCILIDNGRKIMAGKLYI